MTRELIHSVTSSDCRWDYYRGSGKGGQKRNKTNSAVRCTHRDSGAVGQSEDSRSQHTNKKLAFVRMADSREFKAWHEIEIAKALGQYENLDQTVDNMMDLQNLKVEVIEKGQWVNEESIETIN